MFEKNTIAAHTMIGGINEIKNKLVEAIQYYQRALRVNTLEHYPKSYALIQNNLGLAYVKLAAFTDGKENLMRAIEAYQEALKIRTPEKYPTKYFLIQKVIGDTYYKLSLEEDEDVNLSKALDAYQEFLKIEPEISSYIYLQTLCQEVKNKIEVAKAKKRKDK